jgi:hypothetical protein
MQHNFLRFCAMLGFAFCMLISPTFSHAASLQGIASDFNYTSGPYCQNGPNVFPNSVSSAGQGYFYCPSGNIVFADNVTGEINTAASIAGTWLVRRRVGNDSSSRNVTLLLADDAGFDFLPDTACIGTPNPLIPIITGGSGGTFLSDSGLVIDSLTGAIDLLNTTMGLYIISYTVQGQCPSTEYDTLMIHGYPDAYFAYGADVYCGNGSILAPDSISLPMAGYYAAAGGPSLVIDPNTAEIQLSQSAPGIYYIHHFILGGCPTEYADTIEIVAPVNMALFHYVDSVHCRSEAPFNADTLYMGVTFSGTGVVFTDSMIGLIDPNQMPVGSYVVTAVNPGVCAETHSQTIEIVDSVQVNLTVSGDSLFAPGPGSNYQWYLNGAAISGATDSVYFAATSGNYTVRYHRDSDECGTIGSLAYVGVANTNIWLASSKLFPNPSTGWVNYSLNLQRPSQVSFELYNALGNVVQSGNLGQSAVNFHGKLDFSALPSGSYLMRLFSKEGSFSAKLILQN